MCGAGRLITVALAAFLLASVGGAAHAPDTNIAVPALAGRSPTYIVRQLYDIHSGARPGPTTELMKPIAGQLTLQEMIDVAAYLGSKMP